MPIIKKISEDIVAAQKSGKAGELGALRLLSAQLKNKEIDKRGKGDPSPLTEEETIDVLTKEAKKRKEAIELYNKGNRPDLSKKETEDLELVYRYIPRELSHAEIELEIDKIFNEQPSREFTVLIKEAMLRLKGRADGKTVTEIIKSKLS
ncbi:MAG: GatB/YqeY domain-containing protein [Candidatus Liptonbacteria bacterium]